MSNRFISGTDGNVRVGVSNFSIAGISDWKLAKKTAVFLIPHFMSPVESSTGKVYPNALTGLSGATGTLEGLFDTDPTNFTDGPVTGIQDGLQVILDLMISKLFTWGFYNIPAIISDFSPGIAVENQPAKWTASFTVNGIPGISTGSAS